MENYTITKEYIIKDLLDYGSSIGLTDLQEIIQNLLSHATPNILKRENITDSEPIYQAWTILQILDNSPLRYHESKEHITNTLSNSPNYTFKRRTYTELISALNTSNIIFLLGPRKCGKTVCLQQIGRDVPNTVYIDFKVTERATRTILFDIENDLLNQSNRIYLLDEITYTTCPEQFICSIADLFTKYKPSVSIIFTGSQSLALEKWGYTAFSGRAKYVHMTFLQYSEWLDYVDLKDNTADNYKRYLREAQDFTGIVNIHDYLQSCIDETINSNSKTSNYLYGNDVDSVTVESAKILCYLTLYTLSNHVNAQTFAKRDSLSDTIKFYFQNAPIDEKLKSYFISSLEAYHRMDNRELIQTFLFLKACDLITITPVSTSIDKYLDIELELKHLMFNQESKLRLKEDIFKSFNFCIKYPVFYTAVLRDILGTQHFDLQQGLLGSLVECHVRGLVTDNHTVELHTINDDEIDIVNTFKHTALEITVSDKHKNKFSILPEDYRCTVLTESSLLFVMGINRIPYYMFIVNSE